MMLMRGTYTPDTSFPRFILGEGNPLQDITSIKSGASPNLLPSIDNSPPVPSPSPLDGSQQSCSEA